MTGHRIETLNDHEAHVWFAGPEAILLPRLISHYLPLLDSDEAARYRKFLFDRDRKIYLAAHTLLRTALTRYAPVRPAEWVFCRNDFGRPEIAAPKLTLPLRFNLTHTQGLVACGITRRVDIGVDIEAIAREAPYLGLAKRYFAPDEYQSLRSLPNEMQIERFFAVWTLKEAYIKARGVGLSLPLDGFTFELDDSGLGPIRFHSRLGDRPGEWQFALEPVASGHMLAVAIRHPQKTKVSVSIRRADWLVDFAAGP